MKRYKIEYFQGVRSIPVELKELSKTGRNSGSSLLIDNTGKKYFKGNLKNGLWNGGAEILWYDNARNWNFRNWKKDNFQGININFKR